MTAESLWRRQRSRIEPLAAASTPRGLRYWPRRTGLELVLRLAHPILRWSGALWLFRRSAFGIRLVELELVFPALPEAFDGYRLLHLTDLHLDNDPRLPVVLAEAVAGLTADLCVMTGDYGGEEERDWRKLIPMLRPVVAALGKPADGILGVLGNHDHGDIAGGLAELGMRVLINQRIAITRNGERITITGLDDVSRFFTPAARKAMAQPVEGFGIALVHSPDMADTASASGHCLYLCGHTHGGQICLPGGKPIFDRVIEFRGYSRGLWRHGDMTGYTSQGTGYTIIPLRLFSFPEITRITLRRGHPCEGQ